MGDFQHLALDQDEIALAFPKLIGKLPSSETVIFTSDFRPSSGGVGKFMSLETSSKNQVLSQFRRSEQDSGSSDVQIALLTQRINGLTEHMRTHEKDHASRRGLLRMVSRRRSLLDYVRKHDPSRYLDLIGRLGIRK